MRRCMKIEGKNFIVRRLIKEGNYYDTKKDEEIKGHFTGNDYT